MCACIPECFQDGVCVCVLYLFNCLFQKTPLLFSVCEITAAANENDGCRVHCEAPTDGQGHERKEKGGDRGKVCEKQYEGRQEGG